MDSDDSTRVPRESQTFWQRHALTVMVVVMGLLFSLVIAVQVMT
jgi:hypothetical protein